MSPWTELELEALRRLQHEGYVPYAELRRRRLQLRLALVALAVLAVVLVFVLQHR